MIRIIGRVSREEHINERTSIGELAKRLNIRESSYVYLKNGDPVTSDEEVGPEDDVRFLETFSGG